MLPSHMPLRVRPIVRQMVINRYGSISSMARHLGMHQPSVSNLVNGRRRWSAKTLELMCEALDAQPGELLEYTKD